MELPFVKEAMEALGITVGEQGSIWETLRTKVSGFVGDMDKKLGTNFGGTLKDIKKWAGDIWKEFQTHLEKIDFDQLQTD